MARNLEMIRNLLLAADKNPENVRVYYSDIPDMEIVHLKMLVDDRYMVNDKSYGQRAFRLTNKGHNFLALIRNEAVWNKIRIHIESYGDLHMSEVEKLAKKYREKDLGI